MGLEEDKRRYLAAAHAMQTGVAHKMHIDPDETSPKHLRTGVNSAMVGNGALVKLLIDLGVITEEGWFTVLADAMEEEKRLYEQELSDRYPNNPNITLH